MPYIEQKKQTLVILIFKQIINEIDSIVLLEAWNIVRQEPFTNEEFNSMASSLQAVSKNLRHFYMSSHSRFFNKIKLMNKTQLSKFSPVDHIGVLSRYSSFRVFVMTVEYQWICLNTTSHQTNDRFNS